MRLRNLFLVGALLLLISATPGLGEEYGHYFSVVRDTTGAAVEAAQVTVYLAGTNTLAVIYSDDQGTLKGNPHTSDAQGNYDFWAAPGLYKLSITKPGVGAVVTDNIPVGTQLHADSHKEGGTDEIGLNDLAGTLSSARIEDGTILSEDISATAGIEESKLSLNFPTHSNANDPSSNQKAAMSGTSGLPNNLNRYVTSQDPRMTNARTPSAHAASHGAGGGDPVTITQAQIASLNVGTDLTADLEEESHASEHELGGADEVDVAGLSGVLADPQTVEVLRSGVSIASRSKVNLIPGTNVTMSVVDDGTKVDVTVGANVQASGLSFYEGLGLVQGDTTKLTYGVGFDLTTPSASEVQVDLDLSEITVSADEIGGIPANSPPADGDVLQYVVGDGEWVPSQITVDVQEESVSIGRVQSLNFGVGFDTTLSGTDADIDLDLSEATIPEIVVSKDDGVAVVTSNTLDFGTGLVVTDVLGEAKVDVDLSSLSLSAELIFGNDIDSGAATPSDGDILKWSAAGSAWVLTDDVSGSTASVNEEGTEVVPVVTSLDFGAGFDVTESRGEANISLDLTEVSVVATGLNGTLESYGVLIDGQPSVGDALVWTDKEVFNTGSPSFLIVGYDSTFDPYSYISPKLAFHPEQFVLTTIDQDGNYSSVSLRDDGITTNHIDWGLGPGQVQLSQIPGSIIAAQISDPLTDAQVENNLTISSSGSVAGGAIKSGTVAPTYLGDVAVETKSIIIPYPLPSSSVGYLYFPNVAAITRVSARTRGASCNIGFKVNGTAVLASDLTATTSGATTTTIANSAITAGAWGEYTIGASCPSTVTEVTINVTYRIGS